MCYVNLRKPGGNKMKRESLKIIFIKNKQDNYKKH
jgi:hypothetical protein